jgi:hypothetical protein
MYRTAFRAALFAVSIGLLSGCEDTLASRDAGGNAMRADGGAPIACDVEPPTACTEKDLGYADIEPIIEKRCFSCHDGSGEQWGLTSYEHVADWFVEVRAMMATCSMPPPDAGIAMPTEEREKILMWIRCGYKE